MNSNCDAKASLQMAYEKAAKAYTQAVFDLSRAVGTTSYGRYPLLRMEAAQAREKSEQARKNLEEHVRDHGC